MADRPILFSGPMVRAILSGTKTQTRRVVKPWEPRPSAKPKPVPEDVAYLPDFTCYRSTCPFGQPGDRLWVREAHWMDRRDTTLAVMNVDGFVVAKNGRETGQESNPEELRFNHFWKQRPSIHMPRWASRITLEVTGVRVERLQQISEEDAKAEGAIGALNNSIRDNWCAREAFAALWQSINGPGSWDANPWVWVIEFKRVGGSNG